MNDKHSAWHNLPAQVLHIDGLVQDCSNSKAIEVIWQITI